MNAGASCTLLLKADDYTGDTILVVPNKTATKIQKNAAAKKGMKLDLSATAVAANKKTIGGWILPAIAGLAGSVLPNLIGSLLGSNNEDEGDGLSTHGATPATSTPGRGLSPHGVPPPPPVGRGMFLHGSQAKTPSARRYGRPIGAIIHAPVPEEIVQLPVALAVAEKKTEGEGVKKKGKTTPH